MPRSRLRSLMQGLQCGKVPSTSTQAPCRSASIKVWILAAELQRIYDREINVRIDWMANVERHWLPVFDPAQRVDEAFWPPWQCGRWRKRACFKLFKPELR
jgi:hypothetical protein